MRRIADSVKLALNLAVLAAALLTGTAARAAPEAAVAVIVEYRLDEQSVERISEGLLRPLMARLHEVEGVAASSSSATHNQVRIEVQFEGGADEADLAEVARIVEELEPALPLEITSCEIALGEAGGEL